MNKKTSLILFCLSLFLSFFAWKTLLRPGYFSMHDDMQAFRLLEMDKCFKDGQFPCRLIPDGGFGYGYPLFNYYPPLPYYFGEVIHLFGFSILNSVKIIFILGFLASAATMFVFANALWGPWAGFLASLLYTYAPYHGVDIYVRGALNEFWALAWFPAILWTIYQFAKTEKKKYLLYFSFFFALLFLTHNPMVLIFTPLAVAFLFLCLFSFRKLPRLICFFWPSLLAVGLAAFFLLPVVFEKKLVHIETMLMGYFNYLAHFISLGQLFISRHWGYGGSVWKGEDNMSFQIGWPHWLLGFGAVFFAFIKFKKKKIEEPLQKIYLPVFFLLAGLVAAFLTHPRSVFIWKIITPLEYLQFPWRFLALVIFSFSILGGSVVNLFKKSSHQKKAVLILAFSALLLNVGYFRADVWYDNLTDQAKFAPGKGWENQITSGIFDYLPKSAPYPPGEAAPDSPWFDSGEGKVLSFKKGTNWQAAKVAVTSDTAQIKLPLIEFPVLRIKVNNQEIDYQLDEILGRPFFDLSQGEHEIFAKIDNTPIRTLGNWLSLVSWLVFLSLVFKRSSCPVK